MTWWPQNHKDSLTHSEPTYWIHSPTKSPKEGEIARSPVSKISVCVCAFLIEANSSACKRSADRDPVLHNSQFVDVQIKLNAEYSQALFFVKPFVQQLPFQEEEDTSSF